MLPGVRACQMLTRRARGSSERSGRRRCLRGQLTDVPRTGLCHVGRRHRPQRWASDRSDLRGPPVRPCWRAGMRVGAVGVLPGRRLSGTRSRGRGVPVASGHIRARGTIGAVPGSCSAIDWAILGAIVREGPRIQVGRGFDRGLDRALRSSRANLARCGAQPALQPRRSRPGSAPRHLRTSVSTAPRWLDS